MRYSNMLNVLAMVSACFVCLVQMPGYLPLTEWPTRTAAPAESKPMPTPRYHPELSSYACPP